ncbi:MAG: sulfite exporter TauE/SafE family protein [candidate division WOR-3 bacterium]
MDLGFFIKPILLGLANGYFCFGYCFPVVFPYFLSIENLKKSIKLIFYFLLGRLIGYLLFGLLFSLLGKSLFSLPTFQNFLIPLLYIFISFLLISYGIVFSFPHISFCQILKREFHSNFYLFFIGLIMGINLCPPFLLSLINVIEMAEVIKGILFFLLFFLATSIYFFPLIFFSYLTRYKIMKIISQVSAIFAGGYFLFKGIKGLLKF